MDLFASVSPPIKITEYIMIKSKMKYYIKATLQGGKSGYDNKFIYREGYNCHPNPIRENYICGEGRIHLANNIEIACKYVINPAEYYLALPFEIIAEDEEKIAVVDCWLWRIPNDMVLKYNRVKVPARADFERIRDNAWADFERIRDNAWDDYNRITDNAWDDYKRIRDLALADYNRIRDNAWTKYERVKNSAEAELEIIRDLAWKEYERITDNALKEYNRIIDSAGAEFLRVKNPAEAEYKRVTDPALTKYNRIRDKAWKEYERVINQAHKILIQSLSSIIKSNPAIKSHKR